MAFDFLFTNQRVYAFYERLPFGRADSDRYAAFPLIGTFTASVRIPPAPLRCVRPAERAIVTRAGSPRQSGRPA